jgi:hypothetical protein
MKLKNKRSNLFRGVLNSRKGGERILSLWMFAVWGLIAIFIGFGAVAFFSVQSDTRIIQANYLNERAIKCIFNNGDLRDDFLNKEFDIYKECGISSDETGKEIFYLNVSIKDADSGLLVKEVSIGNRDFLIQCSLKEEAEAKYFAECVKNGGFALYQDANGETKKAMFEIIAGSSKIGGKI